MNKERLLDLIDVLTNKVMDEQFTIHTFISTTSCGTVGCAAGWYAFHNPKYFDFYDSVPRLKETGETGFHAMKDYFDITIDESHYIFSASSYGARNIAESRVVSKDDVIERINSLIVQYEKSDLICI